MPIEITFSTNRKSINKATLNNDTLGVIVTINNLTPFASYNYTYSSSSFTSEVMNFASLTDTFSFTAYYKELFTNSQLGTDTLTVILNGTGNATGSIDFTIIDSTIPLAPPPSQANNLKLLNTIPRQTEDVTTSSISLLTATQIYDMIVAINTVVGNWSMVYTQNIITWAQLADLHLETVDFTLSNIATWQQQTGNTLTDHETRISTIENVTIPTMQGIVDSNTSRITALEEWQQTTSTTLDIYNNRITTLEEFVVSQNTQNDLYNATIATINGSIDTISTTLNNHIEDINNPHVVTLQQAFDTQTTPAVTQQPIFYAEDGVMDWSKRLPTLEEVNTLLVGKGSYAGQILFLIDGVDFSDASALPLTSAINDTPLAGKMYYNKNDNTLWEYSAIYADGGVPIESGFWIPNTTLISSFVESTWMDCVHYYGMWHGVSYRGEVPARMTKNAAGNMDPIVYFDKITDHSITPSKLTVADSNSVTRYVMLSRSNVTSWQPASSLPISLNQIAQPVDSGTTGKKMILSSTFNNTLVNQWDIPSWTPAADLQSSIKVTAPMLSIEYATDNSILLTGLNMTQTGNIKIVPFQNISNTKGAVCFEAPSIIVKTGATGQVLTTNADGSASWQTPAERKPIAVSFYIYLYPYNDTSKRVYGATVPYTDRFTIPFPLTKEGIFNFIMEALDLKYANNEYFAVSTATVSVTGNDYSLYGSMLYRQANSFALYFGASAKYYSLTNGNFNYSDFTWTII